MSNPVEQPNPAAPDPLANLYRMSKTAGLASSDYTAVNVPSVVALILGLLSVVANFERILLVIPLTALVLGVIAVYQIRNSNGTQTGLPLAGLGILLALGFGIWASTAQAREAARTRADREQLVSLTEQLGREISGGRVDAAYESLFSPAFRQRVPPDRFRTVWTQLQQQLGNVKSASSKGLYNFEVDTETGLRLAVGRVLFEYERGTPAERPEIIFSFREGQWRIESIPSFFPPPRTAGG
jgi:hypothetical protein